MNAEINQDVKEKKGYHAPVLTTLGSIPSTIQNAAGSGVDGALTTAQSHTAS